MANVTYKRLMRTIDLTGLSAGDNPTLTFRTSYDTEPDWDFVFVEAHTVGHDDWTTLPDANGHTSRSTGPNDPDLASCPAGWHELHPFLAHYQTFGRGRRVHADRNDRGNGTPRPAARRGGRNGRSTSPPTRANRSRSPCRTRATGGVQGLGSFIDDVQLTTGEGSTGFETADMGGWTPSGPPEGSAPNPNNYIRTESVGFEEGAVVSTEDTLYFGFGFEGISDEATRNDVMGKSIDYLLN